MPTDREWQLLMDKMSTTGETVKQVHRDMQVGFSNINGKLGKHSERIDILEICNAKSEVRIKDCEDDIQEIVKKFPTLGKVLAIAIPFVGVLITLLAYLKPF